MPQSCIWHFLLEEDRLYIVVTHAHKKMRKFILNLFRKRVTVYRFSIGDPRCAKFGAVAKKIIGYTSCFRKLSLTNRRLEKDEILTKNLN